MPSFYDILIVITISMTTLPAVILLYHRVHSPNAWEYRHKKASLGLSLTLLLGTVLILYGTFVEPRLLVTNYQSVDIDNFNGEITILALSDIHAGDYNGAADVKKIAKRILALRPDLVVIAGDHILAASQMDNRIALLADLEAVARTIPTYAVPGNHDYGVGGYEADRQKRYKFPNREKEVQEFMESIGIRYLKNEVEKININDNEFLLIGLDEFLVEKLDFSPLQEKQKEFSNLPVIAVTHNPTAIWQAAENKVNLLIAGHTHGGQVRLPFIGAAMHIETDFPAEWYQGLHQYNDTQLFVTSGANESSARVRLFNPPEVALLTIR